MFSGSFSVINGEVTSGCMDILSQSHFAVSAWENPPLLRRRLRKGEPKTKDFLRRVLSNSFSLKREKINIQVPTSPVQNTTNVIKPVKDGSEEKIDGFAYIFAERTALKRSLLERF
jgi:hypothetical protein